MNNRYEHKNDMFVAILYEILEPYRNSSFILPI